MAEKYPGEADLKNMRSHLHKFLYKGLQQFTDIRDKLGPCKSREDLMAVVLELKQRRQNLTPAEKLGWYYRYCDSMSLAKGVTGTFTIEKDWDS